MDGVHGGVGMMMCMGEVGSYIDLNCSPPTTVQKAQTALSFHHSVDNAILIATTTLQQQQCNELQKAKEEKRKETLQIHRHAPMHCPSLRYRR
jgi:hypothetical protein